MSEEAGPSRIQPLTLIDKNIGSPIWVIMKVRSAFPSEPLELESQGVSRALRRLLLREFQREPFYVYQVSNLTFSSLSLCAESFFWSSSLSLSSSLLSISLLVQSEKEIVGTLRGFDEYVNMVLDDVTTIDYTPTGQKESKLNSILLNGANVALLVPGGKPN